MVMHDLFQTMHYLRFSKFARNLAPNDMLIVSSLLRINSIIILITSIRYNKSCYLITFYCLFVFAHYVT